MEGGEPKESKEVTNQVIELLQNSGVLNPDVTLRDLMQLSQQLNEIVPEEQRAKYEGALVIWPTNYEALAKSVK